MNDPLLLQVIIIGHMLGDFYFISRHYMTPDETAGVKHCLGYVFSIALALFLIAWFGGVGYTHTLLAIFVLICSVHIVTIIITKQNFWKRILASNRFIKSKRFVLDQAAHLIILFIIWLFLEQRIDVGCYLYDHAHLVKIILGLVFILRPVSSLIESGAIWDFSAIKRTDEFKSSSKMIGYLERVIIYFALLNGELISAIAIVIAAKTIVRPLMNDKNNNDTSAPKRDYYVIGTLLSIISVFAIAALLGLIPPPPTP